MPTRHPRISVTGDPLLREALASLPPSFRDGKPLATLVRELALIGAQKLRDDHDERLALIARSLERTRTLQGFDREVLFDVKRRAYGLDGGA